MNLREALQGIADEHGRLTAQLVVDEARNPKHPLHNHFEWDNRVAAEKYRIDQARELIRKVRVVYKPRENDSFSSVRAWHSVSSEEGRVYHTAEEIAEDPFLLKLHLQNMEREWKSLREKYERFTEFAEMVRRDLGHDGAAA